MLHYTCHNTDMYPILNRLKEKTCIDFLIIYLVCENLNGVFNNSDVVLVFQNLTLKRKPSHCARYNYL